MAQTRDTRDAREYRDEPKTHLLGRTRSGRGFNRAGLKFEGEWQAFLLADLKPEQVDRVLAEGMLEARLATAREVEKLAKLQKVAIDENVSKAELIQHIVRLEGKLNEQAERIRTLEVANIGDRPPKNIGDLPPAPLGPPPGVPPVK